MNDQQQSRADALTDELNRLVNRWTASMNDEQAKRSVDAVGVAAGIRGCIHDLRLVLASVGVEQPAAAPADERVAFDFLAYLQRQREFSERTFGPGARTAGVCDHIRKELKEIEANPGDLTEWIDVVILALDGAWRAGGSVRSRIAARGSIARYGCGDADQ
ncbi:dATP/dGTP pyrophosphohydrolase domain-containing protein [Burkholderia sp. TSV86]|uniref:dATP/dGTP pyrophosphohydrolase domain-containing protein n=1 Tax=Burkholderia sp. TSV86 TaxID=1385594 RepID=UPI000B1DA590|nr:dATP/dGTP pyrophosphohydrolase domain-containing protein [Burkholderia sp. TSV86]